MEVLMETHIKDVFLIPNVEKENDNKRWSRIGVAFVNKDQSLNVYLDAYPVTGKLHIRERKNQSQFTRGENK